VVAQLDGQFQAGICASELVLCTYGHALTADACPAERSRLYHILYSPHCTMLGGFNYSTGRIDRGKQADTQSPAICFMLVCRRMPSMREYQKFPVVMEVSGGRFELSQSSALRGHP